LFHSSFYHTLFLADGECVRGSFFKKDTTVNLIRGEGVATLLIVDDEAHQRMLYQEELSEEGYQIVLAGNGREALEKVQEVAPDLIVLDIRMPVMDGLEALGEIIGKERNIPVIIHSAYSSYKEDFMSWAADDFVVKSADLTELKRKIRELLGRKKA